MSSPSENSFNEEPPAIDPYEVLGLSRDASDAQVKSAYRKAALKNHPDKVSADKRQDAHEKFQAIAFAYAVLSDPLRRKRYDATGSTSESILDSDDFDWSAYYRAQFQDAVSADAIARFAATYKQSAEERDDVLAAYTAARGDMDTLYETVMLSDVRADDERFRVIIDDAIARGAVESFSAYTRETKSKRAARVKAAAAEACEAEAYAKELGVHDKLFGASVADGDDDDGDDDDEPVTRARGKKATAKPAAKKAKKQASEDSLAALIRSRQQERSGFLDALEAKYAEKQKGPKRKRDEGPSEEEFLKIQAQLDKGRKGKEKDEGRGSGRRAKRARS
ncbi:hypothetical protein TD95_001510 [Thielaviopsis punctulata]|uniref:J domain-containing protein n=1 Tax=Thielaviopsis punctulata TaxID=72032 RepID=A0A0F4ZIJ4_9PEZI|nr:hypothetical protein TD95_001510 [Thielaviopsis punctulata]